MAKTWREILKEKGHTDEQIKAIETAVGTSSALFDEIIASADQAATAAQARLQEATEKEKKINEFWDQTATPKINAAYSDVAKAQAEAAFYRTQAEEAKKLGFIKADAPGFVDPKANPNPNPNPNPGFVPNANPVPGSPQFMTVEQGMDALAGVSYLLTEHQRLFGEPFPGNLRELTAEASKRGKNAKDIWEEKYNVPKKREELAAAAQKAHDDKIRAEEAEKVRREMADKYGNENTRPQGISMHPRYAGTDAAGKPDKLAWTKQDRGQQLRDRIKEQVAKEQQRVN